MDSTFVIDPAYVDFLSSAIPAFVEVTVFCVPFWAFGFRLGWRFADFSVTYVREVFNDLMDVIAMLLVKGYRGVQRLWHKTKRKEDK